MGSTARLTYFLLLALAGSAAAQPKTWQYQGSGQWQEAQTQPAAPAHHAPDPTLNHVQQLIDAHRPGEAHDLVLRWLKSHPQGPERDRGIYYLALAYYYNGDRIWSFYECDDLLDNFPGSRFYFVALDLQYRIADAFLAGYKKRFLGLPIVGMEDEGIEMLYRIQERSPGSAIAERALIRTADHYYRTSQFDLAADAFGAFIRSYPRSNEVPRARLAQAFSNYAQFHGIRYDATPLIDARAQFVDIQGRYPEMASQHNLQKFIDRIDALLAAKMYATADFYIRTDKPRAAVFTYESLIKTYPGSAPADAARRRLQSMPPTLARSLPPVPAPAELPSPTTRPIGG